jgi:hypothetical protein
MPETTPKRREEEDREAPSDAQVKCYQTSDEECAKHAKSCEGCPAYPPPKMGTRA